MNAFTRRAYKHAAAIILAVAGVNVALNPGQLFESDPQPTPSPTIELKGDNRIIGPDGRVYTTDDSR